MRSDGRNNNQLRPIKITRDYIKHAEGSVLIEMGDTKVICTATVEDKVPPHKKNTGQGWITAEYSMLPRATTVRNVRDVSKLKINGRSQEIQRLIGRALRGIVDLHLLGELNIIIDCDVIQADGGTRTASINGGYIALVDCINKLYDNNMVHGYPLKGVVAAISVGVVQDEPMLDLCYEEDSKAQVDMNIIMNQKGEYIEIQGAGENNTFTKEQLAELLKLGEKGIKEILEIQKEYFRLI